MPSNHVPRDYTNVLPSDIVLAVLAGAFGPVALRFCRPKLNRLVPETPDGAANTVTTKFIERITAAYYTAAAYTDSDLDRRDRDVDTNVKLAALWRLAQSGERMDELAANEFAQGYLWVMCDNHTKDIERKKKRERDTFNRAEAEIATLHGEEGGVDPERAAIAKVSIEQLLERHPELKRDVELVNDRFVEEYSVQEVCDKYDCPSTEPYNARARIQRAFRNMKPRKSSDKE